MLSPSPSPLPISLAAPRMRARRLRRVLWSLVALMVMLGGAYAYVSRPAHLRSLLENAVHSANLRVVELGGIAFSPWTGIEFSDLEVAWISSARAPGEPPAEGSSRLRLGHARVACSNWALLWGSFRPQSAFVRELTCMIVRDAGGPDWEWPDLGGVSHEDYPPLLDVLPPLSIEQADVQLFVLDAGKQRLLRRWQFGATGTRLRRQDGDCYSLDLRPTGGARPRSSADTPEMLQIRVFQDRLDAHIGAIELATLIPMLPANAAATLREIELAGSVSVQSLSLSPNGTSRLALVAENLSGSVPFEEELPARQRYMQLSEGTLHVALALGAVGESSIQARVDARLNGSPMSLEASVQRVQTSSKAAASATGGNPPRFAQRLLDSLLGSQAAYELKFAVDGLQGPLESTHPAFFASPRVPIDLADFFRNFRPVGPGDVKAHVRGTLRNADGNITFDTPEHVEASCDPRGVTVRYYRFPYEIHNVRGRFRTGLDGITLEGLTGERDGATLTCEGHVENWHEWAPFALRFRANGVPLNHALFDALPESDQAVWLERWPTGLCDVDVLVERGPGTPDGPRISPTVSVDARLLSGSLRAPDGRRIERADALLSIREDRMRILDLHGFLDGAPIRLRGETRKLADGGTDSQMHIEAHAMPIERATAVRFGDAERTIRFVGVADVFGRMHAENPGDDPRDHFVLHFGEGRLYDAENGEPWQVSGGQAVLSADVLNLSELRGARQGATLIASGMLPQRPAAAPMSLDIRVTADALDTAAVGLAPPDWAQTVRDLKLAGPGRIGLLVRENEPGGPASLELALESDRATPAWLPLPLTGLSSLLRVSDSAVELKSASARLADGGTLSASGVGRWEQGPGELDLRVHAESVVLTPRVLAAMPGTLSKFLARLAPTGIADLNLDRVALQPGTGAPTWRVDGGLTLREASLSLGLELTDLEGSLHGSAALRSDGMLDVNAVFSVASGRLAGRPISGWEGQIAAAPDGSRLRLSNLRGTLCGGSAVAGVSVDPASGEYEFNLVMREVALDDFMQRPREADAPPGGTIDGHVFLRGSGGDDESRRGQGEMSVINASFLKLPVLARVVQVSRERDPTIGDAVNRATLRYNWEGSVLRFDRVVVEGADLRLVGTGTWNLASDRIDFTLVGAHPSAWPRVAILSDLLEQAGQQLLQYRVEGDTTSPRVTVEPLGQITEPLRRLLRE
ncbi:MAG: hypothetical protein IPM64_04625 [Phycisphaerales bacterium]|nr:hypothetical protein [Phycisphaerales bacterium]